MKARHLALILEDESDRVWRFTQALHLISPEVEIVCWRSAKAMIAEVELWLPQARLISLDHDLYPMAGEMEDPGMGWMLPDFWRDASRRVQSLFIRATGRGR